MKTRDNDEYQGLVMDLRGDGEKGKFFLQFMEDWANNAEKLLEEYPESSPADAIRLALGPTENKHGEISVALMGQMLLLLMTHWTEGTALAVDLTSIETALIGECLDAKLTQLESSANQQDIPKVESP